MSSRIPVSVLDAQLPNGLAVLLPALEDAGYRRYGATEHYSRRQSASPAIVSALAAGLTEHMRVGTAGVLLRFTVAARVAADFAALELFFPGRIDLGIAGAAVPASCEEAFAADVRIADDRMFVDRLNRLLDFVRVPGRVPIGPTANTVPELWLCGTSRRSAEIAAKLGMRFAFHQYLAADVAACDVAKAYRDAFRPTGANDVPYFAVAGYGACASEAALARTQWSEYLGGGETAPTFMGTPADCVEQLEELAYGADADELVIDCLALGFDKRLEGLRALAQAWHRSACSEPARDSTGSSRGTNRVL